MGAFAWRLVLLGELGLAALAAAVALRVSRGGAATAVAVFVATPFVLDVAFVGVTYLAGRALGRRDAVPAHLALRALPGEVVAYAAAKLGMALRAAEPGTDESPRARARPVLLIHGIYCNRGVWPAMRRALTAAGFGPVRTVSLGTPLAGIDAHVPLVRRAVDALRPASPDGRVAIVAHSMGGLVARAYLREAGSDAVRALVTLGTPHGGSALARLGVGRSAQQMRPGSAWLAELDPAAGATVGVPVTVIYSPADNFVVPAASARLRGAAAAIETKPMGHFRLVSSASVTRHVIAALEAAGA